MEVDLTKELKEQELYTMNIETEPVLPIDDLPPTTVPMHIRGRLQGSHGETEEELRELWNKLFMWVAFISTVVDMSGLDGITAVSDYENALAELDRGVEAFKEKSRRLKPTNDRNTLGAAMTPILRKDGKIKSHMFFRNDALKGIGYDPDSEEFKTALHVVAHECAHVEAASEFDSAFPGILLNRCPDTWTALDPAKWKYDIYICYQEYIACRLSSRFGKNSLDNEVAVLLDTLNGTDKKADRMVEEFRRDKDYEKVFHGLFLLYGKLIKYSCYVLGTMHGLKLTVEDVASLRNGLMDSWFASYFDSLGELCEALYESYGTWEDYGAFNAIDGLLEQIVAQKGIIPDPAETTYM